MEELWRARVTLPGAIYLAIVTLWLFFYTPAWILNHPVQGTFAGAAGVLLGGGAVLLVAGQVISAFTIIILKIVFWCGRRRFGYFDTDFLEPTEIVDHPILKQFFSTSDGPRIGTFSNNNEFHRRLALIYWGQLAILEFKEPYDKEIQGWVRRRWHAANAYLGASFAAVLGTVTGSGLTDWHCSNSLLSLAAITFTFPGALGLIYRHEVMKMVRFVIDNSAPIPRRPS